MKRKKGFLLAIRSEIVALWEQYWAGIGSNLESHEKGKPFEFFYPVDGQYFMVYKNSSHNLGMISNSVLRDKIVTLYSEASGIIDCFNYNNYLLGKRDEARVRFPSQSSPRDTGEKLEAQKSQEELSTMEERLASYSGVLVDYHYSLKSLKEDVIKRIDGYLEQSTA